MPCKTAGSVSSPPKLSTTEGFSISPIVNSTLRPGTLERPRSRLLATDGVNSQASISNSLMVPGRSFKSRLLSQLTNVLALKKGKKISKTETSKVGLANCKKRSKVGTCLS